MPLEIRTTTDPQEAAEFIAEKILKELKGGKRVLFLVPGGSAIAVNLKVAELLSKHAGENLLQHLTITLTDERYGAVGHADSNWKKLSDSNFNVPEAKLVPVLTGDDLSRTAEKFNTMLKEELQKADYKIGFFGIGKDGHTSGILPESDALYSEELAFGYPTPAFSRITTTSHAIEKLDEAVVWVQGQDKWGVIEDLYKDIDIKKQPAQILKKVLLLTTFTDYHPVGDYA